MGFMFNMMVSVGMPILPMLSGAMGAMVGVITDLCFVI